MLSAAVVLLFFLYALLDALALLPRVAGAILQKNGLGYTFAVMVNTLKRIFVVAYPPLLGWITIEGGSLYSTIYWSYFFGVLAIIIVTVFKIKIIKFFIQLIGAYANSGSMLKSFFGRPTYVPIHVDDKILSNSFVFDKALVFSSAWVYFVYGSALFFVNLFGAKYQEHSAVIYQLVGFVNALGTLLMSFYLDPKVSRNFDNKSNVMLSNDSIVAGQLLALAILGPVAIFIFGLYN